MNVIGNISDLCGRRNILIKRSSMGSWFQAFVSGYKGHKRSLSKYGQHTDFGPDSHRKP